MAKCCAPIQSAPKAIWPFTNRRWSTFRIPSHYNPAAGRCRKYPYKLLYDEMAVPSFTFSTDIAVEEYNLLTQMGVVGAVSNETIYAMRSLIKEYKESGIPLHAGNGHLWNYSKQVGDTADCARFSFKVLVIGDLFAEVRTLNWCARDRGNIAKLAGIWEPMPPGTEIGRACADIFANLGLQSHVTYYNFLLAVHFIDITTQPQSGLHITLNRGDGHGAAPSYHAQYKENSADGTTIITTYLLSACNNKLTLSTERSVTDTV